MRILLLVIYMIPEMPKGYNYFVFFLYILGVELRYNKSVLPFLLWLRAGDDGLPQTKTYHPQAGGKQKQYERRVFTQNVLSFDASKPNAKV